jgi:hypothetical protein
MSKQPPKNEKLLVNLQQHILEFRRWQDFLRYKAIAQNTPNQAPVLEGVWPNAVLCKTHAVCCCVYLNNRE